MSDQNDNRSSSLLLGILIGAALTYLFATKSGRKTKDELLKEGEKLLESLGKLEEEVKEEIEENMDEIPKHVAEIQKKGRRFFFHRKHIRES